MAKLIVANWKENPETEAEALKLFAATANIPRTGKGANIEVVICPPFVYLEPIAAEFKKLPAGEKRRHALGGQDIFWERTGAFTGEIGPGMLKSLGARYTIVGHSERRKILKETDEMINKKVIAGLAAGLRVILCVGESRETRKQGDVAAVKFIKEQLTRDLRGVGRWPLKAGHLVIAYEPIWAISNGNGAGKNCPPSEALAMTQFIKLVIKKLKLKTPVLYGGSVNGKDARGYLSHPEIDGALVGGASLNPKEFEKICQSAI